MAGPLKLKLSKKLKGEGYWAHLGTRREMNYADVLAEASRESRSVFSPELLRMAFETVMESMVRNILKDGVSRTAGEYFKLRLDVKGTFDSPYDYFDEKKHSLVLNLQVLKGLKRKAKGSLVSREYVPVELTAVRNPGGEAGVIDPYKPLLIEGKNLRLTEDWEPEGGRGRAVCDNVNVSFMRYGQYLGGRNFGVNEVIENDSKHILLPPIDPGEPFDTDKPPTVEIEVNSCGGDPNARRQGHRIKAKVVWPDGEKTI